MLKVFKITSYVWENNRIQIKISNGPQLDLKRTSNEPLWGPHGKPLYVPTRSNLNTLLPQFLSSPPYDPPTTIQ